MVAIVETDVGSDRLRVIQEMMWRLKEIGAFAVEKIDENGRLHFEPMNVALFNCDDLELWPADCFIPRNPPTYTIERPALSPKPRRHKALLKLVKPQHEGNRVRGPPDEGLEPVDCPTVGN